MLFYFYITLWYILYIIYKRLLYITIYCIYTYIYIYHLLYILFYIPIYKLFLYHYYYYCYFHFYYTCDMWVIYFRKNWKLQCSQQWRQLCRHSNITPAASAFPRFCNIAGFVMLGLQICVASSQYPPAIKDGNRKSLKKMIHGKMIENDGKWSYSNYLQVLNSSAIFEAHGPTTDTPRIHPRPPRWVGVLAQQESNSLGTPIHFSEFPWNIQLLGKNFNLWISPAIGVLPFGNPPFASIWLFFTFDF